MMKKVLVPATGLGRSRANALAKSAQLIGIGGIPRSFVTGVSTELAVLEELASSWVEHGQGSCAINSIECFTKECKAVGCFGGH